MSVSGMMPAPWDWHPDGIADELQKFTPGLIAVAPFWHSNLVDFDGDCAFDYVRREKLSVVSVGQEPDHKSGFAGAGYGPESVANPGWGARYSTDILGGLGAFTIIAAVEWSSTSTVDDQSVFGNWTAGATRLLWRVETGATRRMRALVVTSGGTLDTGTIGTGLNPAGAATVVALRYDGTNLRVFIDGQIATGTGTGSGTVLTTTVSGDTAYTWSAHGVNVSATEWRGIHHGGNIWNRALSDDDIATFSANFFRFWEPAEPVAPRFGDLTGGGSDRNITGTLTAAAFAMSSAGSVLVSATSAMQSAAATADGAAAVQVRATGALESGASTTSGAMTVLVAATGALTSAAASIASAATVLVSGTGDLVSSAASISGRNFVAATITRVRGFLRNVGRMMS